MWYCRRDQQDSIPQHQQQPRLDPGNPWVLEERYIERHVSSPDLRKAGYIVLVAGLQHST